MASDHLFTIGQGDTLPVIRETLYNGDGTLLDLTNAAAVVLALKPLDTTVAVSSYTGSVYGAGTNGVAQYIWAAGNTATAGEYRRKWKITFASGDIVHIPNDRPGYPTVIEASNP